MANAMVATVVAQYLAEVAKVLKSNAGTAETSHYPALNGLLSGLGALSQPRRGALSAPKGIDGDYPDVAIYELRSNVLVLPVEAKGPAQDIAKLAVSAQAKRYATTFGGGRVLVTNIKSFAVSEIDVSTGKLVLRDRVDLVATNDDLKLSAPPIAPNAAERLAAMIEAACAVRGALRKPEKVAQLLAYHGRLMISAIQATGEPAALLAPIERSLRNGLDMELDEDMLIPTTVQTLLYGLFAAWLDDDDPQNFEWIGASYGLSLPVYADMVHAILTPKFVRKCNLPAHLESAARMLSWVDQDEFETLFEGGAIEYFYEPFLAEFDEHLRDKMGVWYTPRAIADYQVTRVDHHLKNDLGIADGLASTTDDVYVLDPACGTATYMASTLRLIRDHHIANGQPELVASQRAADAARTRVIGFELLPAAFVIAHININRLLRSWGVPLGEGERARIYLTNALTGWQKGAEPPTMPLEDLEAEIRAALEVKGHEPVIAILGNPPYEGYSAAESAAEKELLKPWMETLLSDYGVRKHRLGDLYVRFWRIAIQKIAVMTDRGVISFITNRKWLGGRSYPLMRESLCVDFNQIIVDDFHGETHERLPGDESVFKTKTAGGIRVGAAIVTAIRSDGSTVDKDNPADVRRRDLTGTAKSKHDTLRDWANSAGSAAVMAQDLTSVPVSRATRWKFSAPSASDAPALDEYLPAFFSGVQPVRDEAVLDSDKAVLEARMKGYYDFTKSNATLLQEHAAFAVKRSGYDPPKTRDNLQADGVEFHDDRLTRYAFKPFSHRWLYWETSRNLLHRHRAEMRPHWDGVDEQSALVCPQTARRPGAVRPYVSSAVPGFASVDPDARVFPRLMTPAPPAQQTENLFTDGEPQERVEYDPTPHTAVDAKWIEAARLAGCTGTDNEVGDQVYYALVAIMNSKDWVESQPQQMDDFPSVPIPGDINALAAAADVGRRIAQLSDVDTNVTGVNTGKINPALATTGVPTDLANPATLTLGRQGQNGGQYDENTSTILWNTNPRGGWEGVPKETWEFSIGGFQVIAKHLSYLVGHQLSATDRENVMDICRRIAAVLVTAPECDAAFASAVQQPLEVAPPIVPGPANSGA